MRDDVEVIGAGIVGCALAAFLAERGARVTVCDVAGIGAGASGRGSGLLDRPADPCLTALFAETVELLRAELGPSIPRTGPGTLMLVGAEGQAESIAASRERCGAGGSAGAQVLSPAQVAALEPGVGAGMWACRTDAGIPIVPIDAVQAFAERARRAGVRFRLGPEAARERPDATTVVVAAGASASEVVDPSGAWRPITPLWGVGAMLGLVPAPRHVLADGAVLAHGDDGAPPPEVAFGLFAQPGASTLGSTYLPRRPDPRPWVERMLDAGRRFWPALAGARVEHVVVGARPRAFDDRPLLGRVPGREGWWIAAGHGGHGLSTGIASARMVADAVTAGRDDGIPAALRADRHPPPPITAPLD